MGVVEMVRVISLAASLINVWILLSKVGLFKVDIHVTHEKKNFGSITWLKMS